MTNKEMKNSVVKGLINGKKSYFCVFLKEMYFGRTTRFIAEVKRVGRMVKRA